MMKGSCNFLEGSSSLYLTTMPDLLAIGIVVVEKNFFDLSRDLRHHVFKGLCELMG